MGHGTMWTYAPSGFQNTQEVRTITQVGERKTTFTSDQYGRVATVTDPVGAVTQQQYNLLNAPLLSIGPRADTTGFNYDANHHLIEVIDGRHQSFRFAPNVLGWALSRTDPNNLAESFAYDANGNVAAYTNRRSQTITAIYDQLDRVRSFTQQAEGRTTDYGYDPNGLWTAVTNAVGSDTVWLNSEFLVTRQIAARAAGFKRTVRASYDWLQHRTGVNVLLNDVAGDSIAYTFGPAGELASIRDPLANVTTFGYNSDLLMNSVAYAGGVVATMDYSATHGLARTGYTNSAINGAFGRGYREDSLARVREIQIGSTQLRRFAYDPAGQLASYTDIQTTLSNCQVYRDFGSACTPGTQTTVGGRSYAYDQVGNPTDAGVATAGANRLARIGGDTILYDADGNMTHRWRLGSPSTFEQVLTWNSLGQLMQVTTTRNGTASTLQFGYDGFGRRVTKTVPGNAPIHYIWDGDQVVTETDGGGNTLRTYTYRPGIDQLHSVTTGGSGGQTYYAASDASGNVLGLFSRNTNAVSDLYAYDPFGTITQNGSAVGQSIRWKGLQYDPESGLYYVRARYYAPDLGRFIAEDPIGLEGGVNQYVYGQNDPVNNTDPTGLDCFTILQHVRGDIVCSGSTCTETPGYNYTLRICTGGASPIPGSGPGGRPGIGNGVDRALPDAPPSTVARRGAACTAAAIDAGLATAGDLVSLTGFGWVATKATRGAAFGTKLLRASAWLLEDRLTGALSPTNSNSLRSVAKWQANLLVGAAWMGTSNMLQGESFSLTNELLGLIPGINMGMKIADAVEACF